MPAAASGGRRLFHAPTLALTAWQAEAYSPLVGADRKAVGSRSAHDVLRLETLAMDTPGQPTSRFCRCFRGRHRAALLAAAMVFVSMASGCRSGASTMSAPSWWSFGGGKAADTEKLSAAPPFEGSVKKPSESAAPYPTTTTPNSYAMAGFRR